MSSIPIISIVAFSGTGKTTLLEKLVIELTSRGLKIAVIKHDAHDFEIDREGKDSWRFSQAGADVTVIVSDTKAAIIENRPVPIDSLIKKITDVDIIITEGYKHGPWPKIAVRREAAGKPFPIPTENCIAVVSDMPENTDVPCFGLEEICALADFVTNSCNKIYKKLQKCIDKS